MDQHGILSWVNTKSWVGSTRRELRNGRLIRDVVELHQDRIELVQDRNFGLGQHRESRVGSTRPKVVCSTSSRSKISMPIRGLHQQHGPSWLNKPKVGSRQHHLRVKTYFAADKARRAPHVRDKQQKRDGKPPGSTRKATPVRAKFQDARMKSTRITKCLCLQRGRSRTTLIPLPEGNIQ